MNIDDNNQWFQNIQLRPQACLRLFCFPYAGGGTSLFRDFSARLQPEVEVWPVQLPGRENRMMEAAFTSLEALIASLERVILPYLIMPYAFFGHSMGALISFELTRFLWRQGKVPGPVHLFVSGRAAPQLPQKQALTYHLPRSEFIEELRRMEGTSEEVFQEEELLDLFLPLLRADFTLCETYRYMPASPLNCPITAFGGLSDKLVSSEDLSAWSNQTSSSFREYFFAGGHFFIRQEQAVVLQTLAQELAFPLEKIDREVY